MRHIEHLPAALGSNQVDARFKHDRVRIGRQLDGSRAPLNRRCFLQVLEIILVVLHAAFGKRIREVVDAAACHCMEGRIAVLYPFAVAVCVVGALFA